MPYYGVASGGVAISATSDADTVQLQSNPTALVSALTVNSLAGDDLLSFGADGHTAIGRGNLSGTFNMDEASASGSAASGSIHYQLTAELAGSSTYKTVLSGTKSGALSGTIVVSTGVATTGILTSNRGARSFFLSDLDAGDGNDTVYLGGYVSGFTSNTVDGGAGNDVIAFAENVGGVVATGLNTGTTLNKNLYLGGAGNDTINLVANSVEATVTNDTIQGGQGNDSIALDLQSSTVSATQIFAGGGADTINLQFSGVAYTTIAGGGGNDTLILSADASASNSLILGDAFNNIDAFDGNDTFTGDFASTFSGITIQGMGGNDTISLVDASYANDGGNNIYQLNTGDDLAQLSGLSSSTLQAGAGNDTVTILQGLAGDTEIYLGGGNDALTISGISGGYLAGTIFGGAGADTIGSGISGGGNNVGSGGLTFGYSAFSDSTLSAMDTIAVGGGSGTYVLRYTEGGLVRAANTSNTTLSGANGVFTFTSTFASDVTARAEAMDALSPLLMQWRPSKTQVTSLTSLFRVVPRTTWLSRLARMLIWQAPTH